MLLRLILFELRSLADGSREFLSYALVIEIPAFRILFDDDAACKLAILKFERRRIRIKRIHQVRVILLFSAFISSKTKDSK